VSLRSAQDYSGISRSSRLIFTTSWDDGHRLDLRLAELLAEHGARGTFYVPVKMEDRLAAPELRSLRKLGMEIGAHTVNHVNLTRASDPLDELVNGKRYLEDVLGEEVTAFAYPFGKFDSHVSRLAQRAGYRLARTTVAFRTQRLFDPYKMPTSFQFVRCNRALHVRHALREGNLSGLLTWCGRWRCETLLRRLAHHAIKDAYSSNGVFHIWGHSWEIDSHCLWKELAALLQEIEQQPGLVSMTNSEVVRAMAAPEKTPYSSSVNNSALK
jgi:peptidoglycan-N-acetylglucosamine deacetylase